MLNVALEKSNGDYLHLTLPEAPSEISLSQKIDLEFAQFGVISFLKKHEEELFNNRAGYILQIAKALSETFDIDLAVFLDLKGVNLLEMDQVDFLEHLEGLTGKLKGLNKKQLERSMLSVWNHMIAVSQALNEEIPKEITYKGQVYKMPETNVHPIFGSSIHKSISTKQAIEIIQVNNQYDKWLREHPTLKNTKNDKGFLFAKYVSEIALLMEPDVPIDEDVFSVWLGEKTAHWQDVDWQTAYWLNKWFSGFMKELKEDTENKYFFESTWTPQTPDEREAQRKAEDQGKVVYSNVGIKSIIPVLLELDAWAGEKGGKLYRCMTAPFRESVKLISTYNARG